MQTDHRADIDIIRVIGLPRSMDEVAIEEGRKTFTYAMLVLHYKLSDLWVEIKKGLGL